MILKPKMRVVLIGAAGVGKTSLVERLKNQLKLKVIPEQARIICKKLKYKNIYEIKEHHLFRYLTLKSQIKLEEKYKEFLSDRSTIDCWVHWVRWSWGERKTFESEKYYQLAYNQALKYSHIIYIPRIIKTKDDGFRWNDEDYQNQIDRLIKEILLEWQLMNKTYVVQSIKLKDRVKEVANYILG